MSVILSLVLGPLSGGRVVPVGCLPLSFLVSGHWCLTRDCSCVGWLNFHGENDRGIGKFLLCFEVMQPCCQILWRALKVVQICLFRIYLEFVKQEVLHQSSTRLQVRMHLRESMEIIILVHHYVPSESSDYVKTHEVANCSALIPALLLIL